MIYIIYFIIKSSMKTILIFLFCLFSLNLIAQDDERWEEKHQKRDGKKNDYFTLGLYTGSYIGKGPVHEVNPFFNSISAEVEYFKFRDLSLVVRGIYQISSVSLYDMLGINEGPDYKLNEPYTYKINISINGRYYLSKRNVKPYLQLGINHETNFINNYTVIDYTNNYAQTFSFNKSYTYRYSINLGAGFNFKLNDKLSFDVKYDMYKSLGKNRRSNYFYNENDDNGFNGFSLLGGFKYTL